MKFISLSLFCITLFFGTAHASLIGFYGLDGNGDEKTGLGPDLSEYGTVNFAAGLDGQAASFNGSGSSWLRAPINSSGDTAPSFSWGTWVKLNNPSAWNIFLSNDNGGWDRFTQANSGFWSVSKGGVNNSPVATTTDWTFIAHTFDGITQKLYVDGNPVFSFADGTNSSHSFIDIGRNANSAYPLNGLMDGVFFFDQTLTEQEVAIIRNGGAGGAGVLQVGGIAVPEPSTLAIFALSICGLVLRRCKK
jgi:hypothetical protein